MIKIKPVVICASVALALSFFISILSRNSFPISLLKATIFSVVFGGIAVGIQVVYDKFLSEGEAPIAESRAPQQKTVGSKVDLVVSEEDLPNEENAPTFALDSTRHVLTAADVGIKASAARENPPEQNASPAPASEPRSNEVVPDEAKNSSSQVNEVVAQEKVSEESGSPLPQNSAANPAVEKPSAPPDENSAKSESPKAEAAKSGSAGGDELPELDDFPALGGDDSEESKEGSEDEGVIEDSDFAEDGSPSPLHRTEMPDGTIADSKDASLMAEAIRTVLVKDE